MELNSTGHSLDVNAEDAARVRPKEHDIPITAEEEKARRKAAWEAHQAAQVRQLYDEMVLNKPRPDLVQIGVASTPEEEKVTV